MTDRRFEFNYFEPTNKVEKFCKENGIEVVTVVNAFDDYRTFKFSKDNLRYTRKFTNKELLSIDHPEMLEDFIIGEIRRELLGGCDDVEATQ